MTINNERLAVHQEQSRIAVLRIGQKLLCDRVTVARDCVDDLVEVAFGLWGDDEYVRAARTLQRLETGTATFGYDKLF
jgi:hypothetical protein